MLSQDVLVLRQPECEHSALVGVLRVLRLGSVDTVFHYELLTVMRHDLLIQCSNIKYWQFFHTEYFV